MAWEEGFAVLRRFKAREGHCRVSQRHIEDGFKLGQWVAVQRSLTLTMPPERRQHLDAIEFVWNPLESGWDKYFAALKAFKTREGHCRVPQQHIEGTLRLGTWIANLRHRNTMPAERRQRLGKIGFVWNRLEDRWEEGLQR